jgi:hypothetical protein
VAVQFHRGWHFRTYNLGVEYDWSRSSRRHRIGRAHAKHVIDTTAPREITTASGASGLEWVGDDDRGVELEVVAVILADVVLVIHVMPTALRRRNR